jgi:hypothetical protein
MNKFESYRKWVNEKFAEDGDPVQDMGIGIRKEIIKFLVKRGEFFEKYLYNNDISNSELLLYCCKYEKIEWVKYLLDNGVDASYSDNTSLEWAVEKNNTELIKLLLDHGADKRFLDPKWTRKHRFEQMKKISREYFKESVNEKFIEDSDPVQDMGIGIEHAIKEFIDDAMKGNPHSILTNVYEQISYCVQKGKVEFVDYLIKKLSPEPSQYLGTAVIYNQLEIIKLLTEKYKVNLNSIDAIFWIMMYKRTEMLKYFLENGLDSNYQNGIPLTIASRRGKREQVELLIDYGANVTISDNIALTKAAEYGNLETMKALIYHGAKVSDLLRRKIPGWEYSNKRVRVRQMLKKYKLI